MRERKRVSLSVQLCVCEILRVRACVRVCVCARMREKERSEELSYST